MRTVVVTEVGTRIARRGEVLELQRDGRVARRFRLQEIGQLVLMGPIDITHGAITGLLERGADCVWLSGRGRYRGRLVGHVAGNVALRAAQYARLSDPAFALGATRAIVAGKVANQRNLLLRAQRGLADPIVADACAEMRRILRGIEGAASVDSLRGMEGLAAAAYFGSFGRLIRDARFTFERRTRRPPTDPVNACLSLGYAVLGSEVEGMVYRAGLDPMAGYFHTPQHGRPSLVLDLIEEARPVVVDQVVLRLMNRRQLSPLDFGPPEGEEVDPVQVVAATEPAEDDRAGEGDLSPPDLLLPVAALAAETADDPFDDGAPEARAATQAPAESPSAVHLRDPGRKVYLGAIYGRLRERIYYPPREGGFPLRAILQEQVYHVARVIEGREARYEAFVPR